MASAILHRCCDSRLISTTIASKFFADSPYAQPVSIWISLRKRSFRSAIAKCSSNGAGFIVAEDPTYGQKQIISVTPRLYQYILSNIREPIILKELREETATMRGSEMQTSPDQAQLLAMLVQILGAKRCIELGVYTGYSSLTVALALPETGYLLACERDAKCLEVAKRYVERAGVSHKVNITHGLATDFLTSLILKGEEGSYDFAFVDADKRMNLEYYELLLQLVKL